MIPPYDRTIGFSGHQKLSSGTRKIVRTEIERTFSQWGQVAAATSLAVGSDQIFAECALAARSQLIVIVPCDDYESTFDNDHDLIAYRRLLKAATKIVHLPFTQPSEQAYWAAGKRIVDMADILVAVWDGLPAGGLGGTADIVHYAEQRSKEIVRIWPPGASRG